MQQDTRKNKEAADIIKLRESMPVGELEVILAKNLIGNIKHNANKMEAMRKKVANLKRLQTGLMAEIKKIPDPDVKKILYMEAEREMLTIIKCEEVINEDPGNKEDVKVRVLVGVRVNLMSSFISTGAR